MIWINQFRLTFYATPASLNLIVRRDIWPIWLVRTISSRFTTFFVRSAFSIYFSGFELNGLFARTTRVFLEADLASG